VNWLAPASGGVGHYASVLRGAVPDVPVTVFHLGNNQLHLPIYQRLIAQTDAKRVVILHDAVLQHLMLGSLSGEAYVEEFIYNYGEWNRELAQDLWSRRSHSGSVPEYFARPMLRRAMESAHLVVVHNPAAERLAREHGASRVEMVPHFIECSGGPHAEDVTRWRLVHGIGAGTCLFGVFGHLRESKRVPAIVRACAGQPGVALLVQGEWGSSALASSVDLRGALRIGAVSEAEFSLLIAAVDVGVNLRYPSAGESSGVLARLMAAQKPCIVTRGEEVSHLPAGVVWPVSPGVGEDEALSYGIAYLAQHPSARREMGLAAYEWARAECGVRVLGERLGVLLRSV
jgi:hypothetical protein